MSRRFGPTILTMLLFIGSAVAQQTAAPAFTAAFAAGKAAFQDGDYRTAFDQMQIAFRENPGDAGANFYLGRAAFEMGDYETAVMAFERVLIINPDLPRAKLELARSYFRLGANGIARSYFQEVLDTGPPEPVRRNIEAFIARIDQARKRHRFSGILTLGFQRDTNVGVSPDNTAIQTPFFPAPNFVQGARMDTSFSSTLALEHRYMFDDARFSWKTFGFNYNTLYDDQTEQELRYFSLATGPSIESRRTLTDLQIVGEYLDKGHEEYLRSGGLQGNLLLILNRHLYLGVNVKGLQKKYDQDLARDALNGRLTLGPIVTWGPNRITTRVGVEIEDAVGNEVWEEDQYSYDKWLGSVRYDRRLPWGMACFVEYRYEDTEYDAVYAAFQEHRNDRIHEVTAGVNKKIVDHVMVEVTHTYTKAKSSLTLYEYSRDVTALTLSLDF